MDPDLRRLKEQIADAVAGCSAEQLTQHPEGKWCAAEVLEHLYLTYTGTSKGFQRVVDAGKPLATTPSLKQRRQSLIVLVLGYFPSGREAPAVSRPRGLAPDKVSTEIGSKIVEMDEIITRCEREYGARRRLLDHPVLGPLTAAQWRKFHLVHGLHHLKQIRRLRELMVSQL